jgi:hypothetical protein
MKIRGVKHNNRKKAFEVETYSRTFVFPYAKLEVQPSPTNKIIEVYVDREIGCDGFTYVLDSGHEGTVHIDHVLEYNRDPGYLRDLFIYKLTIEAQKRVRESPLSKREIIRRLGTSATQFYRLLDQTNYKKSLDQLLSLLQILDCDVDFVVHDRVTKRA